MLLSFGPFLTFFDLLILLSLCFAMNNHFYQKSFAHDFFVNNDATLVTLVEQIKAETELVNTKFYLTIVFQLKFMHETGLSF
jgi:hypothetical protein